MDRTDFSEEFFTALKVGFAVAILGVEWLFSTAGPTFATDTKLYPGPVPRRLPDAAWWIIQPVSDLAAPAPNLSPAAASGR